MFLPDLNAFRIEANEGFFGKAEVLVVVIIDDREEWANGVDLWVARAKPEPVDSTEAAESALL